MVSLCSSSPNLSWTSAKAGLSWFCTQVCSRIASLIQAVSSSISSSSSSMSTFIDCSILTSASNPKACSIPSVIIAETRSRKSVIDTLWSSVLLDSKPPSISANHFGKSFLSLRITAFDFLRRSNSALLESASASASDAPSDFVRSVCSSISKIASLITFIVILRSNPLRILSGRLCASSTTSSVSLSSMSIAVRDESLTASTKT